MTSLPKQTKIVNKATTKTRCVVCKKIITTREFLRCETCNCIFDLECGIVTEKRFDLMTNENKQTWKCRNCKEKANQHMKNTSAAISRGSTTPNEHTTTNTSFGNVTKRKPRSILNVTKTKRDHEATILCKNVKKAHSEKRSSSPEKSPNLSIINVSTHNSFDSLSELSLESGEDEEIFLSSRTKLDRSCPEIQVNFSEELREMEGKNVELQNRLVSADDQIEELLLENSALKKQIEEYKLTIGNLKQICTTIGSPQCNISSVKKKRKSLIKSKYTQKKIDVQETTVLHETQVQVAESGQEPQKSSQDYSEEQNITNVSRKLCVISSNTRNKLLQNTMSTLDCTDICHYKMTGAGLKQLLKGLDTKLYNFTFHDYCILFIGDSDFNETENYHELIKFIRLTLQNVLHTNIIICLPTFRYSKHMFLFNRRIEMFNRLLYLDNAKNEYAYILDSNRHIKYTADMFYGNKGYLKTCCYKNIIFVDLKNLVNEISHYIMLHKSEPVNDQDMSPPTEPIDNADGFFR